MMAARQQPKPPGSQPGKVAGANRRKKAKEMDNNKKPSEPLEPERWAMKERPPFNGRSKLAEKTLQEE